jgi:hypothetical protein
MPNALRWDLPGIMVLVGLGATVLGGEVVVFVVPVVVHQIGGTIEARLLPREHIPIESVIPKGPGIIVDEEGTRGRKTVNGTAVGVHIVQGTGTDQLQGEYYVNILILQWTHGMGRRSLKVGEFGDRIGTGEIGGRHVYPIAG